MPLPLLGGAAFLMVCPTFGLVKVAEWILGVAGWLYTSLVGFGHASVQHLLEIVS